MTTIQRSSQGEIYVEVAEKLLGIRDTIAEKVKRQAQLNMNVALSSPEATDKAYDLVSKGFHEFEGEVKSLFQAPPGSEFATMILTASKSKFFFSSSVLLGEVRDILVGKPPPSHETNSSLEWDWSSTGIKGQ